MLRPTLLSHTRSAEFLTNPSECARASEHWTTLRAGTCGHCCQNATWKHASKFDTIVAINGKQAGRIVGAVDARLFLDAAGNPSLIYNRMGVGVPTLHLATMVDESHTTHRMVRVDALSAPLHLEGKRVVEKNWMPFSHDGKTLFMRQICPTQVVECNRTNGLCRESTPPSAPSERGECYRFKRPRGSSELHGGGALVRAWGLLLGVAHTRTTGATLNAERKMHPSAARLYYHYLVANDVMPPFTVRRISAPFRLPAILGDDHDRIQFGSSFTPLLIRASGGFREKMQEATVLPHNQPADNATHFRIGYGVGDCLAASIDVPAAIIRRSLGIGISSRSER